MPSTKTMFNDDDLYPDEISLAMSHGGGSTVSRTSSIVSTSGDGDNDEIVELVRGQCLVIFKRGGKAREVVCAGKYDRCHLKDHKRLQRDERNRSKPGWFRAVFTQKGRLVGGWRDSRMTESEAKLLLEARKVANRRSAGAVTAARNSGATTTETNTATTPESTSTWEDCTDNPGKLPGKACVAVGRQLIGDIESASPNPTLESVTEDIVRKQHRLQTTKEMEKIEVGDVVMLKYGRDTRKAVVRSIYPDTEGDFYLLEDEQGREVQTDDRHILSIVERNRSKLPLEHQSTVETEIKTGRTEEPMSAIMSALQETLALMQQKDVHHRREMQEMQAAIQAVSKGSMMREPTNEETPGVWFAIAKGGGQDGDVGVFTLTEARRKLEGVKNPVWQRVGSISEGWEYIAEYQEQQLLAVTRAPATENEGQGTVRKSGGTVGKWYAVARGRTPESTGIYPSWAKASVEVEGVSNACFQGFRTEEEAEQFLSDHREQQEKTSLQVALAGMKQAMGNTSNASQKEEIAGATLESLSEMGGRVTGPDPSQKVEGKIFGLTFTEENTLRAGLVPHPRYLAPQVQMHLLGQALDVSPLPYSVACVTTDSADSGAALSRALATMAGAQTDIELGGEPMDLNWKSGNKISLTSIKTLTQLRERLSELRQGKRAVEQTLLGRISSVLQHAGYEAGVADEWALGSIIYRMGCDSQYYYIQLHEHILGQAWEDESACDFDNAKLEIEHHAAELRRRRTMYPSRIMMLCAVYAYLRVQSANNFQSAKLQEKRQKLQMQAIKKQAAQIESTYVKMKELSAKVGEGGNGNNHGRRNDKNKPMCWKCHQAGIHTGGKDNCLWKNLSDDEAKAKALDWVAAKQAQIANK